MLSIPVIKEFIVYNFFLEIHVEKHDIYILIFSPAHSLDRKIIKWEEHLEKGALILHASYTP